VADPVFGSDLVNKFINSMMWAGKKSTAQGIFYKAMDQLQQKGGDESLKLFKKAVENCKPLLEVKTRRVGGANYQVPVEVNPDRRTSLAIRWIITYSRGRSEKGMIDKLTNELLDAAQAGGAPDMIQDLAYPLPVMVIAELLGLPASDRSQFKKWSDDLFAILGTVSHKSSDLLERSDRSLNEMTDYVRSLSRKRRDAPQDDLLTALLSVTEEEALACPHPHASSTLSTREKLTRKQETSALLTEEELVSNINILLSTGHETTTHLIGNGLLALLQHPDQLKKLQTQPALLASAIEEMLRYDNPVQITYRSAVDDAEIKGKRIHKGDLVNTIIASANRDPQRFTDPDEFNITRSEGRHLGFGIGIHFCIGAPLVRLEAEVVFETILRRYPGLYLTGETLEWQEHPVFRGLKALPVRL